MDPKKQRAIASKGGKAAHAKGRAHEWTVDEARKAGAKGGSANSSKRREQTPKPQQQQDIAPPMPTDAPEPIVDRGLSTFDNGKDY